MTPTPINVPHHPVFTSLWGPLPYWLGASPEGQLNMMEWCLITCKSRLFTLVIWNTCLKNTEPLCKKFCYSKTTMLKRSHGKATRRSPDTTWLERTMTYQPPAVPGFRHLSQSGWGPKPWEQKWACTLCCIWISDPQNQNKGSIFGNSVLSSDR